MEVLSVHMNHGSLLPLWWPQLSLMLLKIANPWAQKLPKSIFNCLVH